jgi:hypothetical protein
VTSPRPAAPTPRILEVSATERIATAVLRDDEKLLGGSDKRSCDACKLNAAVEKIIRSNGFISINQFLCVCDTATHPTTHRPLSHSPFK